METDDLCGDANENHSQSTKPTRALREASRDDSGDEPSEVERDKLGRWTKAPPTAWKPGQAGGGRGRPALEREVTAAARKLSMKALEQAAQIMCDKKAQGMARVIAINTILERGFGKAQQKIVLETDTAGMDNLMLQRFIAERLREAALTIEAEPLDALPAPEEGADE